MFSTEVRSKDTEDARCLTPAASAASCRQEVLADALSAGRGTAAACWRVLRADLAGVAGATFCLRFFLAAESVDEELLSAPYKCQMSVRGRQKL